jgi:hypothetical protein
MKTVATIEIRRAPLREVSRMFRLFEPLLREFDEFKSTRAVSDGLVPNNINDTRYCKPVDFNSMTGLHVQFSTSHLQQCHFTILNR